MVTMMKSLSGETWPFFLDVFDFVYDNMNDVLNLNLVSLNNDSKRRWIDQKMFDDFRSKEIRDY